MAGREKRVWKAARSPKLRFFCFGDPLDLLLYSTLVELSNAVVVSIGANDGRHNDPLWSFRSWRGLRGALVEPFPAAFDRLADNYGPWRDRFALAQVAVDETSGDRWFFSLHDDLRVYDELGTLDEELARRHAQRLDAAIEAVNVRCLTPRALFCELSLDRVDILLVDAEGKDGAILRTAELERWGVRLVAFEHSQMSAADHAVVRQALRDRRYDLLPFGGNTVGIPMQLTQGDSPTASAWKILQNQAALRKA